MNILHTSSFAPLKSSSSLTGTFGLHSSVCYNFSYPKTHHASSSLIHALQIPTKSLRAISVGATNSEIVSEVDTFEDFIFKDWSFLETNPNDVENMKKIDRIISAGAITESSKILVSIGSEAFVDRVALSSRSRDLLVVHDCLFVLAGIKEKHDDVKCWEGELINVPQEWSPFDVVFLYFLPALPFGLDQILAALVKCCSPGARVVISYPQGRKMVEEQHLQYQDIVIGDLPEKTMLQSFAAEHSFKVVEFVDETGFYLAVLTLDVNLDI